MARLPKLEVLSVAEEAVLNRPCVDCGLYTGSFCDFCLAADRITDEHWAEGQMTPLCTRCCRKHADLCHFCRGLLWARPWSHWSQVLPALRMEL